MDVVTENDQLILLSAFRYALGRRSYIVSTVIEELERNWDKLGEFQKSELKREIQDAIARNQAGEWIDIEHWEKVLELV